MYIRMTTEKKLKRETKNVSEKEKVFLLIKKGHRRVKVRGIGEGRKSLR